MSDPVRVWPSVDENPGVDAELLAKVAELRREIEKFGPTKESSYSTAPALGGNVIRQPMGTATTVRRSPFSAVLARAN